MKSSRTLAIATLLLAGSASADDPTPTDAPAERIPLHTVAPVYPEKARRARVEGEVEVCFNVDRDGTPKRIAVRRSTNQVFERPSINAVKLSSFKPLPPDQQLTGIKTCRTFRFFLTPVAIDDGTD